MSKYKLIGIFVLIFYLITPIFSGIMGYWDYRGPKIYWQPYHEFFHRAGCFIAGRSQPFLTIYRRNWFYFGGKEKIKFNTSTVEKDHRFDKSESINPVHEAGKIAEDLVD